MTRGTIGIGIGMTAALLAACQGDGGRDAADGRGPDPAPTASHPISTADEGALPAPRELPPQVDGKLAERIVPVKLPASGTPAGKPAGKPGAATAFRFGRELEHTGWITTLPEHAQLVSVAYGGGKIFVGGGFGANTMYALDAKTGERAWLRQTLVDPGPTSPVFDRDELAYNTFSCTMEVLSAGTGKVLWTKWLGTETPNPPAFTADLVVATHPTEGGFAVSAYKRKNGADVWSASIDNHILSSPVVAGGAVYVSTTTGAVYKIGLDGKRVWRKAVGATSAPWVDGDELHLAIREGGDEVQVVLDAATGKRLRSSVVTKAPGDVPNDAGEGVWAYEGPRPIVSGGVQFTAMGDRVEARDAHSGVVRWSRQYAKGLGTRELGSVIVAGSLAIVTTRDGKLVGLDRDTGAQRMAFDFATGVSSQPIVADGWMYLATTTGQVIGFDLGQKSIDGWHMWGGNAQHNL